MHRFIDGDDRTQRTLLPHSLEDYVDVENPVRVVEVFIDELDLAALGFSGMTPAATGRPAYHPSTLLKMWEPDRLAQAASDDRPTGVSTVTAGKHAESLTSHDAFFHGLGHEQLFSAPGRSARCGHSKQTFPGTRGNEQDAPKTGASAIMTTDGDAP